MMDQQEHQQYNNNYDGHEDGRRSSLLLSPSPMKDDWRQKLFNFIESKPIGTILFVLLAIDILIIFADLFLDGFYPKCSYIVRDAICTTNMYGEDDDFYVTDSGTNAATCETHHNVESTREVLEILSYCILCIFAIENVLLVGVLGPTNFFGNWTNTFDFCIVFISFVLESSSMYFKDKIGDNILDDLVGFIILGRLVKFATLSFDLIKIEKEEENVQVERLQEQIHELLRQQSVLLKQQQQRQHDDNDNDSSTGYHKLT